MWKKTYEIIGSLLIITYICLEKYVEHIDVQICFSKIIFGDYERVFGKIVKIKVCLVLLSDITVHLESLGEIEGRIEESEGIMV